MFLTAKSIIVTTKITICKYITMNIIPFYNNT